MKDSIALDRVVCDDVINLCCYLEPETVDFIYIDPPFNSRKRYVGSKHRSPDAQPEFLDTFKSIEAYIDFMRPRLLQLHRVLKRTGSFYLHCDWHASHYLKVLLDRDIFGSLNFCNNLIWRYGLGGSSKRFWTRKHDDILFYVKDSNSEYFFEPAMVKARSLKMAGLDKKADDIIEIPSINNMSSERTGYPTQKPLQLLELLIRTSSRPNDLVLDGFCGSGSLLVAAKQLGRHWLGIDVSEEACKLAVSRLNLMAKSIDTSPESEQLPTN